MMRFLTITLLLLTIKMMGQEEDVPLDSIQELEEVEVTATIKKKIETAMKMNVSVDEFLASSDDISFIKRGAYAWEPLLNNMGMERSTITIDGMHIFGACTDKMDPVTSYVESNNLASVNITSGQEGSSHGATIAGNVDLKSKSTPFSMQSNWTGSYQTGFELNNKQFYNQGDIAYSSRNFVAEGSISYRSAENYSDGNDQEVDHSQYKKFNTSIGLAYKTSDLSSLRVDAIFDVAKDVGYPALPMDLWLSRAIITSATYKQFFQEGMVKAWDTKVYYNAIEHYMDDTTRPENLVHMDMPGWSTTYGLLTKLHLSKNRFNSEIQLNAYDNLSIAEMRMYPQDRSERTMFAYSWPWVTTQYAGFSMNNSLEVSEEGELNFGGSLGVNYNHSKYVDFNWIFYPGAPQEKTRWLPSLYTGYKQQVNQFDFSIGIGYGHRAPSVSEGYGYYIYNSFDRYDYIGNPDLKNEVSYELNASAGYSNEKFSLGVNVNYFYIQDYIIGRILSLGSPMNYQSVGVKGYTSLDYATLFNFSLNSSYAITHDLHWNGTLAYARGLDDDKGNLPFIRPLSYQTSLHYQSGAFGFQTTLNGDLEQEHYSPEYGEDLTPAYTILNLSADYTFKLNNYKTVLQVGAENVLNQYYSTYADWGNIPRMGRNFFASLQINF
ncbi:TonB-dependent receptor plug domain-containing protein [Allomuricauda sp. F6463D]|uniref:TonB-dependent receptor plug domain-containing protein n=1 Tax=Allomuricauda sp. F6463D TaxID=2926409 RepID=UPI001FF67B34|nr:TonB-dependent receptor [Muricauda sp. F6463D]MCK0160969.1 TonB-dependent receptor [Muricauda sp. F6463D]